MKKNDFIWYLAAGALAYWLLQKPITRATYSLATGPKYHMALISVIKSGDPVAIAQLREQYEHFSPALKDSFDTTIRHLGLTRPW